MKSMKVASQMWDFRPYPTIYSCGAHTLTLALSLRREREKIFKAISP